MGDVVQGSVWRRRLDGRLCRVVRTPHPRVVYRYLAPHSKGHGKLAVRTNSTEQGRFIARFEFAPDEQYQCRVCYGDSGQYAEPDSLECMSCRVSMEDELAELAAADAC